jgi:4-hydroxybutyrate dehydrogenase/sulfolactaldehyde 3-reductase
MRIERIGFVGLGAMGGPMARNLVAAGYKVQGSDINRVAMERMGGTIEMAASPLEAATGADIVITMLPEGRDVEHAVLGENGAGAGMRSGSVLVEMSTIDPTTTRKIGAALADRGIAMIDSPVGKTAEHAAAGTLTLMVGGDVEVVETVRPVLSRLGSDIFHCGGLGMGGAMKLVNNLLAGSILVATSEALVIGVKRGLTVDTIISVMRTTMAWNNQLGVALQKKGLHGDFAPGFMLRLAKKDLGLAIALARSLGVDAPVGQAAHGTFSDAVEAGFSDLDIGAVLRFREEQASVVVRLPE